MNQNTTRRTMRSSKQVIIIWTFLMNRIGNFTRTRTIIHATNITVRVALKHYLRTVKTSSKWMIVANKLNQVAQGTRILHLRSQTGTTPTASSIPTTTSQWQTIRYTTTTFPSILVFCISSDCLRPFRRSWRARVKVISGVGTSRI